jgi:hypothetical protein
LEKDQAIIYAQKTAPAFVPGRFAFWIRAEMLSALFRSPTRIESCDSLIRVYDEAGNVIQTHKHTGRFQRVVNKKPPRGEARRLIV